MAETLELLRRLVRQQTETIGPVKNLVGPVAPTSIPIQVTREARWLVLRVPGTKLLSLDEFFATYATAAERRVEEVTAINGVVLVRDIEPALFLVRGQVQVTSSLSVTFGITTASAQSEFAMYVNGVLQRRGSGDREFTLSLPAGQHIIELMVASSAFAFQFPPSLLVTSVRETVLEAPIWESVRAGYADPLIGTPAIYLRWYSSPRVGGWTIHRREVESLGLIVAVGEPGLDGEYGLELYGDFTSTVSPGDALYAGFEPMGIIRDVYYDPDVATTYDAVLYTGLTLVRVRLPTERDEINPYWLGRTAGSGVFREVQRMQRVSSGPIAEWADLAVETGLPYEYVLQAYGLFDPSALSPYSEVRYVRAGDVDAPASITILPLYPQVLNHRATVLFTTPVDQDYAGVRVFFGDTVAEGTSPGGNTVNTLVLAETPAIDIIGALVRLTGGTGAGQITIVASIVGATITSSGDWDITPDATTTYEIELIEDVMTDFGLPNTDDQLAFDIRVEAGEPVLGTFYFCSFDHAGNIQSYADGVPWEYDGLDDGFLGQNQPPVVGIRQLPVAVQLTLPAPYNDVVNTAVIELTASDPIDGTTGVTIQYRRRGGATGLAQGPNGATSLFDGTQTWTPNQWTNWVVTIVNGLGIGQDRVIASNGTNVLQLVEAWETIPDATSEYEIAWVGNLSAAAPATTIDNPQDVRSRLVAVSRAENQNWIQVRALDQEGLYSDTLSYTPDYDNSPEFSSVEIRIDFNTNTVRVVGAVDDDTRSLQWWVTPADSGEPTDPDTGGTPELIADTSIQKDFVFTFSLVHGQRKLVRIRPFSGINATGVEGIDYEREVFRAPNTTVMFEPKTEGGAYSATTLRATFLVSPRIEDATVAELVTSATATTLVDTGQTWDVVDGIGQWEAVDRLYQAYFVRIVSGTGVNQVRKILESEANTLILERPWDTIPDASSSYVIQRGATYYRLLTSLEDNSPFVPTVVPVHFVRTEADQYLEFYSVITGVPPEEVQRVLIDHDELAEIDGWTVYEDPANVLNVVLGTPDEDVKRWMLYAKKGDWPTVDETEDGQLDPEFLRADFPITLRRQVSFHAGDGTWYLILEPRNSLDDPGPRLSTTFAVTGVVTTVAVLSNLTVTPNDNGSVVYNLVSWNHSATIELPDTDHTVRVWAYRADIGAPTLVELTAGLTRYPHQDSGGDFINGNDGSTPDGLGSILHHIPGTERNVAGTARTWRYRLDLYDNTPALVASYTVDHTSTYLRTTPAFTSGPDVTTIYNGNCVLNNQIP